MKSYSRNYYENKVENFKKAENVSELMEMAYELAYEVINEDSTMISTDRRWSGYGTWTISLHVNEYHFGDKIAEAIEGLKITTHDEDKEFTAIDFDKEIENAILDLAFNEYED